MVGWTYRCSKRMRTMSILSTVIFFFQSSLLSMVTLGDLAYAQGTPNPPMNVSARVTGPLAILLAWSPATTPEPIDRYEVQCFDSNTGNLYSLILASGTTTFAVNPLTATTFGCLQFCSPGESLSVRKGTAYRFYVRARSLTQSYSTWALSNAITAIDISQPPQSVTLSSYGSLQLRATWLPPADLGGASQVLYDVWIDGGSLKASLLGALVYTTPPWPAGSSHICAVRAVNNAGSSDWSVSDAATALFLPTAPLGVTVSVLGALSLLVQFNAPAQTGLSDQTWPISSYEILIGSSNQYEKIDKILVGGPALQISVPFRNLTKGNTYTFVLRASNAAGFGSYSSPVSAMAISQAQQPFLMSAVQGISRQIRLSWQIPLDVGDYTRNPSKILYYRIVLTPSCYDLQDSDPDISGPSVLQFQTTGTTYVVNNLVPDVCVTCLIAAVTGVGPGSYAKLQFIPKILPLSNVKLDFSSRITGDTVNVNVSFVIASNLGIYDMILIQFPRNFTVDAASLVSPVVKGLDGTAYLQQASSYVCGSECSQTSPALVISRVGVSIASSGTQVSFALSKLVNRHWAGSTGTFQIKTLTISDSIQAIDLALNVSGFNLVPGIVLATVTLDDLHAGVVTSATVTFAASDRNRIPNDFQILFGLGSRMKFTDSLHVGSSAVSAEQQVNGFFSLKKNGENQVLVKVAGESEIPSGQYKSISFNGVRNQLYSGDAGFFLVRVMTASGDAIDENSLISTSIIIPGVLTSILMTPVISRSFALNTFNLTFRTGAVGLPKDAGLRIFFPSCYDATRASPTFYSAAGTLVLSRVTQVSVPNQLDLLVQGVTDFLNVTAITVILSNIRNCYANSVIPISSRPTYSIQTFWTRDGGSILMEQSGSIPESTILPAPLSVFINPSSNQAGGQGSISFSLTTTSSFVLAQTDGGLLVIDFPEGFMFIGDPSPLVSSSFSTSGFQVLGGQGITTTSCVARPWMICTTLSLAFLDTQSWPYGVSITLVLQNIQNRPMSGESGIFKITTSSRNGRVYDQDRSFQLKLVPNYFKEVSVQAISHVVERVGPVGLFFRATNVIPPDCILRIDIPQDYTLDAQTYISSQSCDGTLNVTKQTASILVVRPYGQTGIERTGNVSIVRQGGTLLARGTPVSLTIEGLRRRSSSGITGTFNFRLLVDSAALDEGVAPPDYFVYPSTVVALTTPANSPAIGGSYVTVTGLNFGILDNNPFLIGTTPSKRRRVLVSGTSSLVTMWTSDSMLISMTPPGVAQSLLLSVSVESQDGTLSSALSFDYCSLSTVVTGNSLVPEARFLLPFIGLGYGITDSSAGSRVSTSCLGTNWIADTSVLCKQACGLGHSYQLSMTVGVLSSSISSANSFDLSLISSTAHSKRKIVISQRPRNSTMLGSSSFSPSVRIGVSSAEQTLWLSFSSVVSFSSDGVKRSSAIQLTIGTRISSGTDFFSYQFWSISSVTEYNVARCDVLPLIMLGSGLGLFRSSPVQRMGNSGFKQSAWISDSSISGRAVSGVQKSMPISLTSGVVVSSSASVVSFDTHTISFLSQANIVVKRSAPIAVFGLGIGISDYSADFRHGFSGAESSWWISDSSVKVLTAVGFKWSLSFLATSGLDVGTRLSMLSYNIPDVSTVTGQNLAVSSSRSLSIGALGTGLGSNIMTLMLVLGQTSFEQSNWVSETAVSGYASKGIENSKAIRVTTATQVESVSSLMSYDAHLVYHFSHQNIANKIQRVLIRLTSNSGSALRMYSLVLRTGNSRAEQTFWISDSLVRCVGSPGFQNTMSLSVTSGALLASISCALSYDDPGLRAFGQGNIAPMRRTHLRMYGKGMGRAQYSLIARAGFSGAEMTRWLSDSFILSRPMNSGTQASLVLQVTVGVASGTASIFWTYDSIYLSSGSQANLALSSVASTLQLTVSGSGMSGSSFSPLGNLGFTIALKTLWSSDSTVLCSASVNVQRSLAVLATVGIRPGTVSNVMSYDCLGNLRLDKTQIHIKYRILSLTILNQSAIQGCQVGTVITTYPDNGFLAYIKDVKSNGSIIMSLNISSMGYDSYSESLLVISSLLQSNSTSIDRCTCSEYKGSVPGQFASCLDLLIAKVADSRMDIIDENFWVGQRPQPELTNWQIYSPAIRLGRSACESSQWISESTVQCRLVGRGTKAQFYIASASQLVSTFSRTLVYESFASVAPDNSAPGGGRLVSCEGFSFGVANYCSRGRIGTTSCLSSLWVSDTHITCRSTIGVGTGLASVLTLQAGAVGTLSQSFSYDKSQFFSMEVVDMSSTLVSIIGINYGSFDSSFIAFIGDNGCATTAWTSDSSLLCQLNPSFTAGQVSPFAIKEGLLCSRCKSNEVLLGCSPNSSGPGFCQLCQSCPPGAFRSNCKTGEKFSSPGFCQLCSNVGLPVGMQQFKEEYGDSSTKCQNCSICGGPNQNGTEYDLDPCTIVSDVKCRPCRDCSAGEGVLVGCASKFEGECVFISQNVTALKATAAGELILEALSTTLSFVTSTLFTLSLLGEFIGTELTIPSQTKVNFTVSVRNISLSIIVPSLEMIHIANRTDLFILSEVIYCGPEGTLTSPPANLTFRVAAPFPLQMRRTSAADTSSNSTSSNSLLLNSSNSYSPSICRWKSERGQWEVLSALPKVILSTRFVTVSIPMFATYALCVQDLKQTSQESRNADHLFIVAIILPVVFGLLIILFCLWRWRLWRNGFDQKPDFSSRLMPIIASPARDQQDGTQWDSGEDPEVTGSRIFESPAERRSPHGTLDTAGGVASATRELVTTAMYKQNLDSFPRYRIQFDEENEGEMSLAREDETEILDPAEDISITERPPIVFSSRFAAPKAQEVQGQTWSTDLTVDNNAGPELYSYREETEESISDDEPSQHAARGAGNKADWMC